MRSTWRAKVKTPFEFVISAVRATNANVVTALPMVQTLQQLGMPLYGAQPPTGYSMTADAWVNTGALIDRMNFSLQLVGLMAPQRPAAPGRGGQPPPGAGGQPPQGKPRPAAAAGATGQSRAGPGDAGAAAALAQLNPQQRRRCFAARCKWTCSAIARDTSEASVDHAIGTLLSGGASDATRQVLAKAKTPQELVALTLGSPEFQKR